MQKLEQNRWPGFSKLEIQELQSLPWKESLMSAMPTTPIVFFIQEGSFMQNGVLCNDTETLYGIIPFVQQYEHKYTKTNETKILYLQTDLLAKFLLNHEAACRAFRSRLLEAGYSIIYPFKNVITIAVTGQNAANKCIELAKFLQYDFKTVLIVELQKNKSDLFGNVKTPTAYIDTVDDAQFEIQSLQEKIDIANGAFGSENTFENNDFARLVDTVGGNYKVIIFYHGPTLSKTVEQCHILYSFDKKNLESRYLLPPTFINSDYKKINSYLQYETVNWYDDFAGQMKKFISIKKKNDECPEFHTGFTAIAHALYKNAQQEKSPGIAFEKAVYKFLKKLKPVYPRKSFFNNKNSLQKILFNAKNNNEREITFLVNAEFKPNGVNAKYFDSNFFIKGSEKTNFFPNGVLEFAPQEEETIPWNHRLIISIAGRWGKKQNNIFLNDGPKDLPQWLLPFYKL